jgi:cob(I)alamin adenosyltransferase
MLQVRAYGAVDEFSSILGVVMTTNIENEDKKLLTSIQYNLYQAMNALCGGNIDEKILLDHTQEIETYIDKIESDLEPLHRFILPQGTPESVWLHVARTTCRRAEREVVAWTLEHEETKYDVILSYLNRLSDLFFVLSRRYNKDAEIQT